MQRHRHDNGFRLSRKGGDLLVFSSISQKLKKIMIHIKSPKEEHKEKELSRIMEKKRESYGVE